MTTDPARPDFRPTLAQEAEWVDAMWRDDVKWFADRFLAQAREFMIAKEGWILAKGGEISDVTSNEARALVREFVLEQLFGDTTCSLRQRANSEPHAYDYAKEREHE